MVEASKVVVEVEARTDQARQQITSFAGSAERDFGRVAVAAERVAGREVSHLGEALRSVFDASRFRVLEEGGARISVFGSALEHLGAIGLATAGAIGVLALALEQAHQAGEFASALEHAATAAHVTTTTLQEYRQALRLAGGEEQNADEALRSFAISLGNAQGGMRRAALAFSQIGIGPEELRNIHSVDEGIQAVAEHLGHLDTAARAAALSRLGLAGLAPLVEAGVERMREFLAETQRLGLVMDENLIRRASQANEEFETLTRVVQIQLHTAFADLIPVLNQMLGIVVFMAGTFGDMISAISTVEHRTQTYLEARHNEVQRDLQPTLANRALDIIDPTRHARNVTELYETDAELGRRQSAAGSPAVPPGGDHLTPPPGHARARQAAEDHSAQATDAADQAILAAKQAELQAQLETTHDLEERGVIQKNLIGLERQQQQAALQKRIDALEADRHISDGARQEAIATLRAADLADQRTAILRQTARDEQTQLDLSARRLAMAQEEDGYRTNILGILASMAHTMQERRELEASALHISQVDARQALEDKIARQNYTPDEAATARAGLAGQQQAEVAQLNFNTRGPLAQLRDAIPQTAAAMNEAFQNVAANGVNSLVDGLVAVANHTRTLGDVFKQVSTQILSDLLRIELQRSIEGPLLRNLAALIPGDVSHAFGSVGLGDLGGVGKHAAGGPVVAGARYLVGEHGPEQFTPVTSGYITPNGRTMRAGGQQYPPAPTHLHMTVDLRGANGDATIAAIVRQAAIEGGRQVYRQVMEDIPQRLNTLQQLGS